MNRNYLTDKNPFEDISTDILTEDFVEANQSLKLLIAQHKLIIACEDFFTKSELLKAYASLVQYLEEIAVASQMAQEAELMTRENVVINPDNWFKREITLNTWFLFLKGKTMADLGVVIY